MEKPHIPFTSQELANMLQSENPDEQASSARRIWTDWPHLENREILLSCGIILYDLLKVDKESRKTWHLMMALGTLNHTEAIALIRELLIHSKSENIRGFAADAMSRFNEIDDETNKVLWGLAKSDSSLVVRVNSIRALGSTFSTSKNDEISLRLLELLKHQQNTVVISTIIGLLGEIGSIKVVPDLVHFMLTKQEKPEKKIAAIALDQIADINEYEDRSDLIKKVMTAESLTNE